MILACRLRTRRGSINLTYNYPSGSNNGKIGSMTDSISGETVSYQYDSLNRLISAAGSGWTQTQSYDGFGNLTARTGTGTAQSTTMSTPADPTTNRLSGYFYDANGNQISTGYGYDAENRIMSANAGAVQYAYDAQNKRIWQASFSNGQLMSDVVLLFGADGKQVGTYLMNQAGGAVTFSLSSARAYFGGKLIAQYTGIAFSAVVQDRLGSVGRYYPYGEERNAPQLPNDQVKFATYTRDSATGLDYADQRYYASTFGRFMTPDPYKATNSSANNPAVPPSWNRYTYVLNDPIRYQDPRGLFEQEDCPEWGCDTDGPPVDPFCDVGYHYDGRVDDCVPNGQPPPNIDCNALTLAVGFPGLTYSRALVIWNDGSLSTYSSDATAATIAALATVTWYGESTYSQNLKNQPAGGGRVAIGPFQVLYPLHAGETNNPTAVFGTNLQPGQTFNGNLDANIAFGIGLVKSLYERYGDNAAGRYIGVNRDGKHPEVDKRQELYNSYKSALINLFENTDCFPHI